MIMAFASVHLSLFNSILLGVTLLLAIGIVNVSARVLTTFDSKISSQFITWDDVNVGNKILMGIDLTPRHRNLTGVIVVDQSGNGDSTTVQGAIDLVPDGNRARIKILVLPGIYREKVVVPISKPFVSLIGKKKQSLNTIIVWNDKSSDRLPNGKEIGTFNSATFTVFSDYFCATEITFQNTIVAKPGDIGRQAVALRVSGDKALFYKVTVLGFQDTLLDEQGSHYFLHCFIQGTVDFIFGNALSIYRHSEIHSVADQFGAIAAHSRDDPNENTGFSFLNCSITGSGMVDLGRAWGVYSRVVYSYCDIEDIITSERWSYWEKSGRRRETAVFGEFRCRGKGAISNERTFNYDQARPYLNMKFIGGDKWLRL